MNNADATVFAFILPPVLNVVTYYYALGLKNGFDGVLWSAGCCLGGDNKRKMQAIIIFYINQQHRLLLSFGELGFVSLVPDAVQMDDD